MATALPAGRIGTADTKNIVPKSSENRRPPFRNRAAFQFEFPEVSSDEEDFVKFKPTLIPRGVLLSCEVYMTSHQWNTLSVIGKMLSCAVCGQYCKAEQFNEHISSAGHKKNMDLFEPLHEFGPSIIRKINDQYHCGICNKFLEEDEENYHFLSEAHKLSQNNSSLKFYEFVEAPQQVIHKHEKQDSSELSGTDDDIDLRKLSITDDHVSEILNSITEYKDLEIIDLDTSYGEIVIRPFNSNLVISKQSLNTIRVGDKATCHICKTDFDKKLVVEHMSTDSHTTALTVRGFLHEFRNNLIGLINANYHCGICNILFGSRDEMLEHIDGLIHMVLLGKSVEKCNPTNVKSHPKPHLVYSAIFSPLYVKLPPTRDIKLPPPRLPMQRPQIPNLPLPMWPMPFQPPNLPFPFMMPNLPNFRPPPGNLSNVMRFRGIRPFGFNRSRPNAVRPPPGFWPPNFPEQPMPNYPIHPVNGIDQARPEIELEDTDSDESQSEGCCSDDDDNSDKENFDIYQNLIWRLEKEQIKVFFNSEKKSGDKNVKKAENGENPDSHVYVKLNGTLFKIKKNYYNTLVKLDRRYKYCFVCSIKLRSSCVNEHLECKRHCKNLSECNFAQEFWKHLVRQVEDNYHCGICNLFIPKHKLHEHLASRRHDDNLKLSQNSVITNGVYNITKSKIGLPPKREDLKLDFLHNSRKDYEERLLGTKFVMAGNEYQLVKRQNWQGIVREGTDFKCLVCDVNLKDEMLLLHLVSYGHVVNAEVPVLNDFTPNILRLVKNDKINCVTCNKVITNKKDLINEHLLSKTHLYILQSSPVKVRFKEKTEN